MKNTNQRMFGLSALITLLALYSRKLGRDHDAKRALEMVMKTDRSSRGDVLRHLGDSKSQLQQDIFVLTELCFKTGGYFVEFGATNGVDLSNTYLLEKGFGWTGILAEPARSWHSELKKNRSSIIESKCVWSTSGQTLKFNETASGEFSTIDVFSDLDQHSRVRESGQRYEVETISLVDLLETYNAPNEIDYLSIDTEGSEYDILNSFDFERFKFKVITCEHNFTPQREKIHDLLTQHGYVRKFEEISEFDDWYVAA